MQISHVQIITYPAGIIGFLKDTSHACESLATVLE